MRAIERADTVTIVGSEEEGPDWRLSREDLALLYAAEIRYPWTPEDLVRLLRRNRELEAQLEVVVNNMGGVVR